MSIPISKDLLQLIERHGRRSVEPETFHFVEMGRLCKYWTDGVHRVSDSVCRCGKGFLLFEVPLGEKE